jgi:hypothetical protein
MDDTHVLAIKCENLKGDGYLGAEINGVWMQPSNTKCRNTESPNWTHLEFDDSEWSPAFSFG